MLIGGFFHQADLKPGLLNWVFVLLFIYVIAAGGLYVSMEIHRRRAAPTR